ncbi:MAG: CapA family protein [Christensenellales bacterium]
MRKKLCAMLLAVFMLGISLPTDALALDAKVQSISLYCEKTTLQAQEQILIIKKVLPENCADPRIVFTSSNPKAATVSEYGLVTGVSDGTAVITAAAKDGSGVSSSCGITVKTAAANSFSFEQSQMTITTGSPCRIRCIFEPDGSAAETLVWSSSNENIASVNSSGVVRGVKKGSATITAVYSSTGQKQTCRVTVKRGPLPPLSELELPRYHFEYGIYGRYSENPEDKNSARIMLTGDIMALNSQQSAARNGSTYDFNKSFDLVKNLFAEADFVIGNMETTLSYSRPYTCELSQYDGNPNCNAPSTFLDALRYAGYDAVVTANNHCCDTGAAGLLETLDLLDNYRIAHAGTYRGAWQKRALHVSINGIRVAFLAYTEFFNRKSGYLTPQEQEGMLSPYSAEAVARDVKEAKAEGAEFVIAYNHGGTADTHSVNGTQKKHAQEMANAGVDLVINSHPHVLQRADILQAKGGRKVLVIYSMGNFVASMSSNANKDAIVLDVKLTKKNGKVVMESAGYYPCRILSLYEDSPYCVVPVSPAYNGGDNSSVLQSAQKRIAKVMGDAITFKQ